MKQEPYYVYREHVSIHDVTLPPETCPHFQAGEEENLVPCGCWRGRVNRPQDHRGPLLLKRIITSATARYIKHNLPWRDGEPQSFRWSKEHNDLFYSWLYHYGEEHPAGKQYNCVIPMERLLEFKTGTGLYFSAINRKLQEWAAAVNGWQNGPLLIAQQEERMQYQHIRHIYAPIEEWLNQHGEVDFAEHILGHVWDAWKVLARNAGELVDLDITVSDYVERSNLIKQANLFHEFVRVEREDVALRTLEEIHYEILPDRPQDPPEFVNYIVLQDVTPALRLQNFGDYFQDGRPDEGFRQPHPLGRPENIPPPDDNIIVPPDPDDPANW
ncbi:hypothetical protein R1sor_025472 [Riccia sorocarpa]|uniref:Uncharacterized protein n=1 Tax=Riccia sorocarpa TaxID=122646 RepID=A0ABD3GAS0_9MARC